MPPPGLSCLKSKLSLHRRSSALGVAVLPTSSNGSPEAGQDEAVESVKKSSPCSSSSSNGQQNTLQNGQSAASPPQPSNAKADTTTHLPMQPPTLSPLPPAMDGSDAPPPPPKEPRRNSALGLVSADEAGAESTTAAGDGPGSPAQAVAAKPAKNTEIAAAGGPTTAATAAPGSNVISGTSSGTDSATAATVTATNKERERRARKVKFSTASPAQEPTGRRATTTNTTTTITTPTTESSGVKSTASASNTAPSPPTSPASSPSSDSETLHNQRLQLQQRLKRLKEDPLFYDPALLPSPTSVHDSPGSYAAKPALSNIYEHFSTDPLPFLLRPRPRHPDELAEYLASPSHHLNASSATPAATSPPPPPPPSSSSSKRNRHPPPSPSASSSAKVSSPGAAAPPSRPPAAPRKSTGSGPAIRQTPTPRHAHFVLDPAPAYAVPSPPAMPGTRKIWVRRPGASPTLITISEDDLVDDVRETILRKYANSLGKTFDAPDLHLRLHPRDQKDRQLQPDEHMCRTLDTFFPSGQTVDDAIIIDIPRRTPKVSPHPQQQQYYDPRQQVQLQQYHHTAAPALYYSEDGRPLESGEGYFPPVGALPSPHMQLAMPVGNQPHSIAVLGSGHLPTIPSPSGMRPRAHREQSGRPRMGRTHTSGSGKNGGHGMHQHHPRLAHSRTHSSSSDAIPVTLVAMPRSPVEYLHPVGRHGTPPPRSSSARPKRRPKNIDLLAYGGGSVATVPPISVLIVEDNPINLKLLEAFVKRLKVRWQTATNGREAVKKWRTGGFHLVLMDIQLPVMNGLEATREIRRLERINSIGVFSSVPSTPQEELALELKDKDRLDNLHMFKGPVIIVALTASSLQSDRHEALAAGCNDFLTKPVNFVWLERKVLEWGCMQALIDYDGWRQWKDFALAEEEASQKAAAAKIKAKKARSSLALEV